MSEQFIWGSLQRALNDPTTIDEAIAAGIAAHNNGTESHLGAEQSLETHRENPIIDHPAESVPNDKIKPLARAYVAIVDPASEVDYDSVDSAWAYAESVGGGNILITPGTHYLGSKLLVDGSINLFGTDPDTCIVVADADNNFFFETGYWSTDWSGSFEFRNLTLRTTSAGFFKPKTSIGLYDSSLYIDNCILDGAGGHLLEVVSKPILENSKVFMSTVAIIGSKVGATVRNVDLDTLATSGVVRFIDPTEDFEIAYWSLDGVRTIGYLSWASGVRVDLAGGAMFLWSSFKDCTFRVLDSQTLMFDSGALISCDIVGGPNEDLTFAFTSAVSVGCTFTFATGGSCYFDSGIYIGCFMTYNPDFLGDSVSIIEPVGLLNYRIGTGVQTVFNFNIGKVWQVTPTGSRIYTTSPVAKGEHRTMIILTSGTTSYSITFSTGFKTTGTLNTGNVSARRFVIEFVSDGTDLIECSRTVAIA